MKELEDIINEIGAHLDEDDSIYFYDCTIYKSFKYEKDPQWFQVMHDPFPSHFQELSPKFPTLLEAVNWLIEYSKNERHKFKT